MNNSTDTEKISQNYDNRTTKEERNKGIEELNRDDIGIEHAFDTGGKETSLSSDGDDAGLVALPITSSTAIPTSPGPATESTGKRNKRRASRSPSSERVERTPSPCLEDDTTATSSEDDNDSDSDSEIEKPVSPPLRLRKKGRFKSPLSDPEEKERERERQNARNKDERVFDRDVRENETEEEWRCRMSRIPALSRS